MIQATPLKNKTKKSPKKSKMSNEPDQNTSKPPAKKIRYHQDPLKGTEKLYLTTKLADVYFTCGSNDGATIPAHKNLLAANSDVFERMFCGELQEDGDNICVTDTTSTVFKEFLQFFYRSEVKLTADNIADILHLGHKYNVEKCMDACVSILIKGLSHENVCSILSLAIHYELNDLLNACHLRIISDTMAVFAASDFLECTKEVLAHILQLNSLSCSEVDVFEACMSWIRGKSEQNTVSKWTLRKYLGVLYYEIRFASMTMQQFCKLSAKYNQVLSTDFETIANIIVDPDYQSSSFNKRLRQAEWNANAVLKCDFVMNKSTELKAIFLNSKMSMIFSSSQTLLLGQFKCQKVGVFGAAYCDLRLPLPVDVEITESTEFNDSNAKSILKMKAQLYSKATDIVLPHPVLIRSGYIYEICIRQFPDDHLYYYTELKMETRIESDITIINYRYHIHDNKMIGLVSGLFFNKI